MSVGRINLKTIDYYRFKKLIIDGNRDDYGSCSKEIKALCDHVQTFHFRDEQFDEETDRCRFEEICCFYRQILSNKRINPIDMRIKSGWWGDNKSSTYSVGKIKPSALKDLLIAKAKSWSMRHGVNEKQALAMGKKIDGPGIFVFKHKERHCFQYVGRADKVFARCSEKLKHSFEGTSHEPLSALFILTMASDWEFYFTPIMEKDDERLLRILENDIILRHDCIWPHGLNFLLRIDSLLEVSEFRKSCLRHHWPPDVETLEESISLDRIRKDIETIKIEEIQSGQVPDEPLHSESASPAGNSDSMSEVEVGSSAFEGGIDLPSPPSVDQADRPPSPLSVVSSATYTVDSVSQSSQQKHPNKERALKNKVSTGKENIGSSKFGVSAQKAKGASPRPMSSPKKLKKPEWRGVLDSDKSSDEKTPEDSPAEENKQMWMIDVSSGVSGSAAAPERPSDLPIKNSKIPTSPKKIAARMASSGKKKL